MGCTWGIDELQQAGLAGACRGEREVALEGWGGGSVQGAAGVGGDGEPKGIRTGASVCMCVS